MYMYIYICVYIYTYLYMYLYTIYWDMMRYGIMGFERKAMGL